MTHRSTVAGRQSLGVTLAFTAILLAMAGRRSPAESDLPLAQKHSWEVSFNQGDVAAVAALYAPDAELVMSGAGPVRGREAIRIAIDKMFHSGVKVRIATDRAAATGDLTYFYGPYSVLSKQLVVERGMYLEVSRRYHGHWLIELDVNATGASIVRTP